MMFLLPLFLTVWQISASVIIKAEVGPNCHASTCLSSDPLVRRTVRSLCSAPRKPSVNSRSVILPDTPLNRTLWRRVLDPPSDGDHTAIGDWVLGRTEDSAEFDPISWSGGPVDNPEQQWEMNTAVYKGFDGKKELSLGMRRLQGCTALAIISRKGVYAAHYWENISFDPDKTHLQHKDWIETPEEIFERTVLKALRQGVGDDQKSLTKLAPIFTDDYVKAYLIRPRYSQAKEKEMEGPAPATPLPEGYDEHWQRMKDQIVRIMPKIGEPGRWSEVKYDATDDKRVLDTTSRGRMLLMYDPASVAIVKRTQKPKAMVKLWVENNEIHSDSWEG